MISKGKYRNLCEVEHSIPIFSKDWWMDAVCGKENWDVLLVEKNNEIIAALPYYLRKKYIYSYISQPKLTQTNGLWIKYPNNQKYSTKLAYEKKVMGEIINQLESLGVDYYSQHFHHSITNWLPFYWSGYQQTTRYTYVIEQTDNIDLVFNGF